MIVELLLAAAFADAPDCVTWDTPPARPEWALSLAEPTVVAEFAARFGLGELLRTQARKRSAAVAVARDAFIRAGPAAGARLFPRAVGRIDSPFLQCPVFPPVPPDPSRCPSGICRPGDTLANRCGSGRGPGIRADGTLAVLLTVSQLALPAPRGKTVPIRVAVARHDRNDKLRPATLLLSGHAWGPGLITGYSWDPVGPPTCDWSEAGPWQELGRELAGMVVPAGGTIP